MSTLAPPRDPQLPGSLPTCRLSSSYFASVSLTCERTTPHVPSSLPCFAAYQRSQLGQTQTVSRPAETANSASRGVAALHPLAHTSWRTCYLVGTHSGAKLGPSPCQRAWTGPCLPPLHRRPPPPSGGGASFRLEAGRRPRPVAECRRHTGCLLSGGPAAKRGWRPCGLAKVASERRPQRSHGSDNQPERTKFGNRPHSDELTDIACPQYRAVLAAADPDTRQWRARL